MSALRRTQLIQDLASGLLAPRDLAGVSRAECAAISQRAEEARARGEVKVASLLLELLRVIEPDVPDHLLRHAEILHELSPEYRPQVLELLQRYLDADLPKPRLRMAAALRLRGSLLHERGGEDVQAAQLLEALEQRLMSRRSRR